MTDYSRDRLGPDDEDRLPWLEPVEEEADEGGVGTGKLILWLIVALLVIGLVAGAIFWMRSGDKASSGEGALIKAPDSYYKERPAADDDAAAGDETVYSASKGNEVESMIDIGATAETPVNVDRAPTEPAAPATAPKPSPTAAKTPETKPAAPTPVAAPRPVAQTAAKPVAKPAPRPETPVAPAPAQPLSGGSTIQLGAFSTAAKANAAWKNLSARFAFLAGLTQSVAPVQSGDKTLYRLRASGGNAGDICGRLRTAGESCTVIG